LLKNGKKGINYNKNDQKKKKKSPARELQKKKRRPVKKKEIKTKKIPRASYKVGGEKMGRWKKNGRAR